MKLKFIHEKMIKLTESGGIAARDSKRVEGGVWHILLT